MPEKPEQDIDLQRLKAAVHAAVESGVDLQRQVRDLMLAALSSGRLDMPAMREVTRTTLEGVSSAAGIHGDRIPEVIRQSVAGVEEALQKAAEASKLAIQEAAGRTAEFSRNDLSKALDDLAAIEELFLETLGSAASAGSAAAAAVFGDFLSHFHNSGTDIGRQLAGIMAALGEELPPVANEGLRKGLDVAHTTADQLARFASGFLAGIEQGLDSTENRPAGNGREEKGSG
ncbi:MAG: hypothetical protein PVJ66_06255 [Gammaproteobacteria bacterium]|jgi:hypothetical protein